jgi:lipopolysaccharide/colanic/teichoic acid biosynthesis glycosyltransferase
MTRRLIDIVAATLALVLLSPVLAAVAVAILLSDPGPVLHRARRVGRHGVPFTMLKFRTMRLGGRAGASAITASRDPRVFPLAWPLRRCKLDELPQLVNIIRGDMSIVGPRPEDRAIVAAHYRPEHMRTLDVRPGLTSTGSLYYYLTGEATLTGAGAEAAYVERLLPLKLALDLVYLSRRGARYDVLLVARTIWAIAAIGAGRRRFDDPPEMAEALAIVGAPARLSSAM